MGLGILIPIMMTLIIIVGPLQRALYDRDYDEIVIDIIILAFFWGGYLILSQFEFNLINLLNRIFN